MEERRLGTMVMVTVMQLVQAVVRLMVRERDWTRELMVRGTRS